MFRRAPVIVTPETVAPHGRWSANEIARRDNAEIDWAYGRGISGHAGTVRIGVPTYGVNRFSGDLGPLQTFARFRTGATTSTLRALNQEYALPTTSAKVPVNPILGTMTANSLGANLH